MIVKIKKKQSSENVREQVKYLRNLQKANAKLEKKEAAVAEDEIKQKNLLYRDRLLARCAILPFSDDELRISGVTELELPEQRLAAWWTLVVDKILSDIDYIIAGSADYVIEENVRIYLRYHERIAANLLSDGRFSSTYESHSNIECAVECAQKLSNGNMDLFNVERHLESSVRDVTGYDEGCWPSITKTITPALCSKKSSQNVLPTHIACAKWMQENHLPANFLDEFGGYILYMILQWIMTILLMRISGVTWFTVLWMCLCVLCSLLVLLDILSYIESKITNPQRKIKRNYIQSIWKKCECLPLSSPELESLEISNKSTSTLKLAAWWSFMIAAILTDPDWTANPCSAKINDSGWNCLKMFDLPEELQLFLLQQADEAGKLFFDELPRSFDQTKILDYAWSATRRIAMGGLSAEEAEAHIAELIQKQIG